jgi:hypothetical protein
VRLLVLKAPGGFISGAGSLAAKGAENAREKGVAHVVQRLVCALRALGVLCALSGSPPGISGCPRAWRHLSRHERILVVLGARFRKRVLRSELREALDSGGVRSLLWGAKWGEVGRCGGSISAPEEEAQWRDRVPRGRVS